MPRFLKVKGKAGHLVSDPRHAFSAQARYIGMQIKPEIEGLKKGECYEPVEQVIEDDQSTGQHVRRAIAKGDLIQIGKPEVAASMDLAFKPASAAKKGG